MRLGQRLSILGAAGVMGFAAAGGALADDRVYAGFPVTVKGYAGDKTSSVSYSGQAARNVLHDSLKKLASKGDAAAMTAYYEGKGPGRTIVAPATKGKFVVAQGTVDEVSKDKNIAGKTYKGAILGWPNAMTGPELVKFWIAKAAAAEGGVDKANGYDYAQLISKFIMGAMNYNQAVDGYLDENLGPDKKPNDKPYSDGAAYTGKEHSWDEAFGYFGAPAHAMKLSAADVYAIAKQTDEALALADHNGDGKVDLKTEMTFGPAYYAAGFDKGGKTTYLHTIVGAFLDGRQLLADAGGEKLTDAQRAALKGHAATIAGQWQKVLAEAVFKYAGEVYEDLEKLETIIEANGDIAKVEANYIKHWAELKGFSLALQTGKDNLGETAVSLNRLIGFGPVLPNLSQVVDLDSQGNYLKGEASPLSEYMVHMLRVQALMIEAFGVEAREHDATGDLAALREKLGSGASAEND